jgi:hypothetical protein
VRIRGDTEQTFYRREQRSGADNMARNVTPKDGAEAVAMLDKEKPARRRTPAAKAEAQPKAKAPKESKAALVRALLDQGKTVRECADGLKGRGITWSYCWDVAAAYEKKTGKVFIASHGKAGAK